jgi:ABC-type uncharacterized transport system ATPase subunit
MGIEWDIMMMRLEEHADPTQGLMLTGFELDDILELTRRINQLMDVAMMWGREREERLRKRIDAKQKDWEEALRCVCSL